MINPIVSLRKLVFAELITCMSLVFVAACCAGIDGAKSALLGGLAYIIPNAYRTFRAFRYSGARASRLILKGFYQGEAVKFALSIVIFASIFSRCTVNPVIFFGTYIGMQMLIWFAPLLIKTKGG